MADPALANGAAWIAGEIVPISEAKISVIDWGLTRSDITYDVVHVWDGAFFRLDDYLDRFHASIRSLRLEIEQTREEMKTILHDMVAASGLQSAYVSMVASRGTPAIPGTRDPRLCNNHFYAWVVPFVWVIKPEIAKRGAHIKVSNSAIRISPDSVDPIVKNYHWGDMTKALFEALDEGFDTTVLLDERGYLTEGPGFNIFAIIDGKVVTPVSGALHGITRKTVLEISVELGLKTETRDISLDEFLAADEVFTSTTGGGPVAVTRVNQHILGNDVPGVITRKIIDSYWNMHKNPKMITNIVYQ
ncbi:MAG: aminotransferase class IV [Pseudomonadota bacterium]